MKANPVFSLYIPTKLVFGCGEIKKLSSEKLPGKKALVVISSGTSMRKYGYLERVLAQLRLNNVETLVYDKILPNPIKEHVMEAAAICREEKCDFVVGLGGGSSIDSAKSIAVMASATMVTTGIMYQGVVVKDALLPKHFPLSPYLLPPEPEQKWIHGQ